MPPFAYSWLNINVAMSRDPSQLISAVAYKVPLIFMTRIFRAADLVYIKRQGALGQCNVLLTIWPGAIPLHVSSTSKEFSWGYRIDDGVSIITNLRYKSCCELDNCSASVMRSRCLIHNTKPATTRRVLLTSTKMGNHENPHGKSTNWCETRCCVARMQRLWKHLVTGFPDVNAENGYCL